MNALPLTPEIAINVLVVEDSTVTRLLLVQLLEADPQIRVIGAVDDGQAALDFIKQTKPDVILMDIHMPRMNGFEATRIIMETQPVPIIISSASSDVKDTAIAFRALKAGAIACIDKPFACENEDFSSKVAHMLETVKLMSEVKVVRRNARTPPLSSGINTALPLGSATPIRLVSIGASTGGPPVLQAILAGLPKDFSLPILVVQHIAHGFLAGMVHWLAETTGLQIHAASYGTWPVPGNVYLAPDDLHMGVGFGGRIILSREPPENHVRPSVSFLFRTMAEVYGPSAVGVLLSGMGCDGARELKTMKDRGAFTIAQDEKSSVVHGMPGAAIALGGATHVLPADRIAGALAALAKLPTPSKE